MNKSLMKKVQHCLPFLIIVGLSLSAWAMGIHHYFTLSSLKEHQHVLESLIFAHETGAVFIFMGLYILIVGLSIPGAAFMTLTGGFLFGQTIGTIAVVVAATLGATVLFAAARLASSSFLARKAGPWVEKMKAGFQENAFAYLLTLRLIPLFPFVAVNLAAAVFQIPLKTFIIATFVGIIPGSFVFVSMGNALKDVIQTPDFSPQIILDPKIILAFAGLGLLSLLPVLYRHFQKIVAHAPEEGTQNPSMPDAHAPGLLTSKGSHKPGRRH